MAEPIRCVIDTDPGIDDGVAILFALASGLFDVAGITTVAGNLGIETTTRNAGRILALAGRPDIPVVAGAERPLARKALDTKDIHGGDGLGGVAFPEPKKPPLTGDAVAWLAGLLEREPAHSVDVLALGPLTNIARLARDHAAAARRIRRLVAMGGAVDEPGNIGPRTEFNLAADPEAAQIVLSAGLPLTLVPLDVTRKVRATRDYCRSLEASGAAAAVASARLIEAYFHATTGRESRPLHDPCVMLLAARPELFSCETIALSVDTGGGADAGALTRRSSGATAEVAMGVEAGAALALLADGLHSAVGG
jgi:purine nucleosidase/pyrimidine-specific ribonucleoside hydrolase